MNESRTLMMPIRTRVPFDLTNIRNAALVYSFQIPILCMGVFYAASVSLFTTLVFNVCGQLSILSHKIMNLDPDSHDDMRRIFSNFVGRHIRIIWYRHKNY